ncbi:LydA holin phage, holin superfamily III [[Luteovulum] sphaeroides subsp. megalophilum]|uniref:phage holin family protein n=1 Tax=Cereibacter sphaeroides TaxID=1063 RepID=UPI000B67B34F|nr:phage holin family protein [Cereibacter sphaeroides]SNT42700.1 LydA holin phage, holin superfamily III [[Luteovulum] sphaeroides subsp. megalophilum]
MPEKGLIDTITALWGGAIATLIAAAMGRLMYHTGEVRARRRAFFGRELLWEIPALVAMAFVGEALSSYLSLDGRAAMGLVAMLAYLGPRGTTAMIERLWRGRSAG